MRIIILSFFLLFIGSTQAFEYIIVSGGPALNKWEKLRVPHDRHDRWWGNFIRTARVRIQQLKKKYGEKMPITWLIYKRAYQTRAREDKRNLVSFIDSARRKYKVKTRYFRRQGDLLNYLNHGNNRPINKIIGFEFFGHSNAYCFLFDYSNEIMAASKTWLHERDIYKINPTIFHKKAFCKSWGCHTGESMSKVWRRYFGIPLWGAVGKTDYSNGRIPFLSSKGGKWVK